MGKLHEDKENESIYQNEMNSNEFVMMKSGFNLCDENSNKWVRNRMSSTKTILYIEKNRY